MGNRAEQFSMGTMESKGAGRWRHSTNQRTLKITKDRQWNYFHPMDKAVKAASRKKRVQRSQREFEEILASSEDQQGGLELLGERRQFQFDRALQHVFDSETATPKELDYIDRHGQEKEYYMTDKGNQVIITIVEFTRPVV